MITPVTERSRVIKAKPGDWLLVKGTHADQAGQRGLISEVLGAEGRFILAAAAIPQIAGLPALSF